MTLLHPRLLPTALVGALLAVACGPTKDGKGGIWYEGIEDFEAPDGDSGGEGEGEGGGECGWTADAMCSESAACCDGAEPVALASCGDACLDTCDAARLCEACIAARPACWDLSPRCRQAANPLLVCLKTHGCADPFGSCASENCCDEVGTALIWE